MKTTSKDRPDRGRCFHCGADWKLKTVELPLKCPRCWMRLDADPKECNCKFCLPRRQVAL